MIRYIIVIFYYLVNLVFGKIKEQGKDCDLDGRNLEEAAELMDDHHTWCLMLSKIKAKMVITLLIIVKIKT